MPDVEVHIDLDGEPRRVGLLRRNVVRRTETVTFEYDDAWLADDNRFSIEPALTLTRGVFPPQQGQSIFGSIGDSAPDTWGRRLMQRAERRRAERDGRPFVPSPKPTICSASPTRPVSGHALSLGERRDLSGPGPCRRPRAHRTRP